ncbi:MAG TPA: winged helix-turn-helix domain-containing protein [Bryobacteraceae bacterium]
MDERKADPEPPAGIAARAAAGSVAKFGAFELRLDTGELRKYGVRIRLQTRPFQILQALLEQPGHVVTREDLRARLWSINTFVDFESGLNTAINRLRSALGDSADNPIFVETLARVGYRFIAPVTWDAAVPVKSPAIQAVTGNPPNPVKKADGSPSAGRRRTFLLLASGALIALLGVAIVLLAAILFRRPASFRQLTFSRGFVRNARFTHDGKHVVYSADFSGKLSHLFMTDTANSDTRDLGFEALQLASVSPTGQIGLLPHSKNLSHPALETVPLRGGSPRELSLHAVNADWGPDDTLCVITENNGLYSVEYPPGRKLYTSHGWIDDLRVSPRGDRVAFAEHLIRDDDAGQIVVVTSTGKSRVLSPGWESIDGLAWHPSGREIWFTAARAGIDRNLMAVNLNGETRQVAEIPGGMLLRDISPSGDVLIARAVSRMSMLRGDLNGGVPQDISWLDWSRAVAISADGRQVLFDESGQGGGRQYSVFIYDAAKQSAERLGDGRALDLSADGRWALAQDALSPAKLALISVSPRKITPLVTHGFEFAWVRFLSGADCPEILLWGNYPGKKPQLYRQDLPNGVLTPISTPLSLMDAIIDETGRYAVGASGKSSISIVNLADSSSRSLANPTHVMPIAFAGGHRVLTTRRDGDSVMLEFLDLQTGRLVPYRQVKVVDPVGTAGVLPIRVAKDLHTFVYSRVQTLSTLFVVSGWN